jgi:hypothetical protein
MRLFRVTAAVACLVAVFCATNPVAAQDTTSVQSIEAGLKQLEQMLKGLNKPAPDRRLHGTVTAQAGPCRAEATLVLMPGAGDTWSGESDRVEVRQDRKVSRQTSGNTTRTYTSEGSGSVNGTFSIRAYGDGTYQVGFSSGNLRLQETETITTSSGTRSAEYTARRCAFSVRIDGLPKGHDPYSFNGQATDEDTRTQLAWSFSRMASPEHEPRPLVAEAGGPYQTTRGATLVLDGSGSSGDIQTARWTFAPTGDCASTNADAEKKGLETEVIALCTVEATLTVSDGTQVATDQALVEVVERKTGWTTPFEHVSAEGRYKGIAPLFDPAGDVVTVEGGENVDARSGQSTILGAGPDLYELEQVDDPAGPFHEWWYVSSYKVEVKRQSRVNEYLLPDGPAPLRTISKNLYTVNDSLGYDIVGFLAAVREHERHHSTCLERALAQHDPAPQIELQYHSSSETDLEAAVDSIIATAENSLSEAMRDPFEESFATRLVFPRNDTGEYDTTLAGDSITSVRPAGVGSLSGTANDPLPPNRCRR